MQTAVLEQNKIFQEKRWLMWLMQIWDENGRMPTYITVKHHWPDEYCDILHEFGDWNNVERKLCIMRTTHEQAKEKQRLDEQRQVNLGNRSMTYSLEDYLVGILKVQVHLHIQRLPSLREIDRCAKVLNTPRGASYQRRLLTKDNWVKYLNLYLATPEEGREKLFEEMEKDLDTQRVTLLKEQKERQLAAGKAPRPNRAVYSVNDCLEGLCRIQEYLQITTIPTKAQIERCAKEIHTPGDKSLHRVLGEKTGWSAMLIEFQEHRAIEQFIATYNNLQVDKVLNLDGLWERMLQVATPEEQLRLEHLTNQLAFATAKAPVAGKMTLNGRRYNVTFQPIQG